MPYKKNIEALAKKNPQLAQLIDSAVLTGRYVIAPSQRKDKLPSMVDIKFNKNFYNNIDPYRVAEAFSAVKYTDLLSSPNIHFVGGPNIRLSYPYVFNFLNMSVNIHYLKSINILEQPICYFGNREYYSAALQLLKEGIHQVLLLYGNDIAVIKRGYTSGFTFIW